MNFPARNLTSQYISSSYQDVVQQYIASPTSYLLDGYGNSIFSIPSASIGYTVITSDVTSSMTVASASYLNEGANIYLSQSFITAATNSIAPPFRPATLFWDNNDKTFSMYTDHEGVTLQIGHEMWIRCYAGENISNGSPVYITSSIGETPIVKLALADARIGSLKSEIIGLATENISSGSIGVITTSGHVHDLDTSMFSEGQAVYLSHLQSGSLINTIPPHPFEIVTVGYVLNSDSGSGAIHVALTNISQNTYPFVGITTLPTITTGSNGLVNIGTGSVNLCTTSDGSGLIQNYNLNSASFYINTSSFDAQYIIANYNSGSPQYQLLSSPTSIDSIQSTLIYSLVQRILGPNNPISIIGWDSPGNLLANKLLNRTTNVNGIERSDGLIIGVSGSRYATITSGSVWVGSSNISQVAVNSFTDEMILIAHSASAWSSSLITQLTNTECDDGINVVSLGGGNNHWVSNYIYRGCGNTNSIIVMYSGDYGSLTDAIIGQPPNPPIELKETSILIGRVIYNKSTEPPDAIESAFVTNFVSAGALTHNDLSGLQGGTAAEYYHLTAAQYSRLSNGTSSYSETSSYATGLFPTISTITSDITLNTQYSTILCDCTSTNIIVTMPNIHGQLLNIKKIDTGSNYVRLTGSYFDGSTYADITTPWVNLTLQCSSSKYYFI